MDDIGNENIEVNMVDDQESFRYSQQKRISGLVRNSRQQQENDRYLGQEELDEVNISNLEDSDEDEPQVIDESENYPASNGTYEKSPEIQNPTKHNLHLGQLIFNNHNIIQNINMYPTSSLTSNSSSY